jgi:hypothetical protein
MKFLTYILGEKKLVQTSKKPSFTKFLYSVLEYEKILWRRTYSNQQQHDEYWQISNVCHPASGSNHCYRKCRDETLLCTTLFVLYVYLYPMLWETFVCDFELSRPSIYSNLPRNFRTYHQFFMAYYIGKNMHCNKWLFSRHLHEKLKHFPACGLRLNDKRVSIFNFHLIWNFHCQKHFQSNYVSIMYCYTTSPCAHYVFLC